MQGWICLHRRLLEWEWYSDINATRLFLHCLLKANHKDKKWQGKVIPRGSFITGRNVLADETGLTVQQIRTSLDKLKSTNDITIKSTNKNSLVTVVNYGIYQDNQEEVTNKVASEPPNEQPTNNQQITTTNNDNNGNNENNEDIKPPKKTEQVDFSVLGFTPEQVGELKRIRRQNKGGKLTQRVVNSLAKEFHQAANMGYTFDELLTEWECRSWKSFKAEWIKPKQNQSSQYSESTRRAFEVISRMEGPPDEPKRLD